MLPKSFGTEFSFLKLRDLLEPKRVGFGFFLLWGFEVDVKEVGLLCDLKDDFN